MAWRIDFLKCLPLAVIVASVGCSELQREPEAVSPVRTEDVIKAMIDSAQIDSSHFFAYPSVRAFYELMRYKPVWSKEGVLLPQGDSLITILGQASYLGLNGEDYHFSEIEKCNYPKADPVTAAQLDILLTDAFYGMAHHLQRGRLTSKDLSYRQRIISVDSTLVYKLFLSLRGNEIRQGLEFFEPKHRAYKALKQGLKELLQKQQDHLTDSSFQAALNKITVNLERWRWESKLPENYVLVNIPAFELYLIEQDSVVFQSRVIVGTTEKPTPILNGTIHHFVIYPYWNVPRSITVNELLPKIKQDSSYLRINYFDVLDRNGKLVNTKNIDWSRYTTDDFPFALRQREGDDNTLGIIKFIFSNPYAVYLHDTNAPVLFNRRMRALSHGCVRVEKAKELAYHMVRDDSIYCSPLDLTQYLQLKERQLVNVYRPLPLRIRYFTCASQNDGIEFYPDIYGRDDDISDALNSNTSIN